MTFDVIKKQLTELIDDRKSLALKDAEHDEIYLKTQSKYWTTTNLSEKVLKICVHS